MQLGQVETTNILTNNRMFAKVEPQATMEFDLPKRDILINEAMNGAMAITKDFGALVADPNFLGLTKCSERPADELARPGLRLGANTVRNVLPGLPRSNDEQPLSQAPAGNKEFGAAMEALIPDPAVYKFETGTGFEIRPVIQPDGQAVVFHFNYMYTTNIREPVRADEKHLGRVKRHFIDTDVQLGNYELREVSRYTVALKAARTSRGVSPVRGYPRTGHPVPPAAQRRVVAPAKRGPGPGDDLPDPVRLDGSAIRPGGGGSRHAPAPKRRVPGPRTRRATSPTGCSITRRSRVDEFLRVSRPNDGPTSIDRRRRSPTSTPTAIAGPASTCGTASCRRATTRSPIPFKPDDSR